MSNCILLILFCAENLPVTSLLSINPNTLKLNTAQELKACRIPVLNLVEAISHHVSQYVFLFCFALVLRQLSCVYEFVKMDCQNNTHQVLTVTDYKRWLQ